MKSSDHVALATALPEKTVKGAGAWTDFLILGIGLACRAVIVGLVVVLVILCLLIAILRWKFSCLRWPLFCAFFHPTKNHKSTHNP